MLLYWAEATELISLQRLIVATLVSHTALILAAEPVSLKQGQVQLFLDDFIVAKMSRNPLSQGMALGFPRGEGCAHGERRDGRVRPDQDRGAMYSCC